MNISLIPSTIDHCIAPAAIAMAYDRRSTLHDRGSVDFVVREQGSLYRSLEISETELTLVERWLDIEADLNSTCVGLVCHADDHGIELADLVAQGFAGAAVPGAIVVIGCDLALMARLLDLASGNRRPYMMRTPSGCIPFEWPSIMVIGDIADPALVEGFHLARQLRDLDVPVETTAVADLSEIQRGAASVEVQAFFRQHLVVNFPKMF